MTDYFALLDQPRRPWLDPEELKQVFHEKTLRSHPDALVQSAAQDSGDISFALLNEAYQVLREPKRRLHHLLSLEGLPPTKSASVPAEIERLFPSVAALIQEADALTKKLGSSTNALSRSLVRPELLKTIEKIRQMLKNLAELHHEAARRLQKLSNAWQSSEPKNRRELHALYLEFSYLTRWLSELEEKQTQLEMTQ